MSPPFLIVGLGNPGPKYESHRHNVGFMAVDQLNQTMKLHPLSRKEGEIAKGSWRTFEVITLKPGTFMNASGEAVQSLMAFYKIPLTSLYVIHDDLDLQPGDVRLKKGGGDGGHNGLRSITAHIGADYARIRLGIGRPIEPGYDISSYVLGNFSVSERQWLDPLLDRLAAHWASLWADHPSSKNDFLKAVKIAHDPLT